MLCFLVRLSTVVVGFGEVTLAEWLQSDKAVDTWSACLLSECHDVVLAAIAQVRKSYSEV